MMNHCCRVRYLDPLQAPEPREYVARGVARQAAGVLTGAELGDRSPEWPLALHASVEHPSQPHVRAAYAAAFARTHH